MAKARNSNPVLARIFILVPHDCARRTAAARRLNVVGNTLEWKRGSTEEAETRDGPRQWREERGTDRFCLISMTSRRYHMDLDTLSTGERRNDGGTPHLQDEL